MKFYLCEPTAPTNIEDTGFHPAAVHPTRGLLRLEITPGKCVVGLPNNQARPTGYRLLGQGTRLRNIAIGNPERNELRTFCGLDSTPQGDTLGDALFNAKTTASPNDSSTLEPYRRVVNCWFAGELLKRRRLDTAEAFAQKVLDKLHNGYVSLRDGGENRTARKWLRMKMRKIGLSRSDIQRSYVSDGEPIDPESTNTETGTPDLTWNPSSSTLTFSGGEWYFTGNNNTHKIARVSAALSDGDMSCTHTPTAQTTSGALGPCVRVKEYSSPSSAQFYTFYNFSSTWYLRRCNNNNPAIFSTIATFSRTGSLTAATSITVEGSDISVDGDGDTGSSPYTDTTVPDTHLYTGWFSYGATSTNKVTFWEATDELGGGIDRVNHLIMGI